MKTELTNEGHVQSSGISWQLSKSHPPKNNKQEGVSVRYVGILV